MPVKIFLEQRCTDEILPLASCGTSRGGLKFLGGLQLKELYNNKCWNKLKSERNST